MLQIVEIFAFQEFQLNPKPYLYAIFPFLFAALALFEHVNLVYGTISEFCTQSGCADMTGPGNR